MRPDQLGWMLLRIGAGVLALLLFVGALLGLGFWLGRRGQKVKEVQTPPIVLQPIVQQAPEGKPVYVDRYVPFLVPGQSRVERIQVPVEVTRFQDRVVTVTKEVKVPVEQLIEVAPQVIRTTIGSILTDQDAWVTPKNKVLTLVQESPGVYVAGLQEGWKIEQVETTTKLPPPSKKPAWRIELYPGVAAQAGRSGADAGPGGAFNARRDHLVVQGQAGYSVIGNGGFGSIFVGYGL